MPVKPAPDPNQTPPPKPAKKATPEKPHPFAAGCTKGDHVYVRHPKRGVIAVRVLATGKDGLTGKCDQGQRHGIPWSDALGHKSRMLHRYKLVEQGADGALLEGEDGKRRYLAGQVPVEKPEAEPSERTDDPITGGMDKLAKAAIAGGAAADLFDAPVTVASYVRDGHTVHGYAAIRKKAPPTPANPPPLPEYGGVLRGPAASMRGLPEGVHLQTVIGDRGAMMWRVSGPGFVGPVCRDADAACQEFARQWRDSEVRNRENLAPLAAKARMFGAKGAPVAMDPKIAEALPGAKEVTEGFVSRLMPGYRVAVLQAGPESPLTSFGFVNSPRALIWPGMEHPVPAGNDGGFDVFITLNFGINATPLQLQKTLLHELGHAFQFARYQVAPEATKRAIHDQWMAEAMGPQKHDVATASRVLQMTIGNVWTKQNIREDGLRSADRYFGSFEEWFAERFVHWCHTDSPPDSPITRFFSEVVAALREAYAFALDVIGIKDPGADTAFRRFAREKWAEGAPKAARAERRVRVANGPDLLTKALRPSSLYVSRPVLNGADIAKHYRDQGCSPVVDPKDMHVTLAFSRKPVDWSAIGERPGDVHVPASDERSTAPLGDAGATVLHFGSDALQTHHAEIHAKGAEWSHPSYRPHVTVSYGGKGFDKAKPWTGPIHLGPEVHKPVKDDWKPAMSKSVVLFLKAGPVKGRPGLSLVDETDKTGKRTKRWEKTGADPAPQKRQPGAQQPGAAAPAVKPAEPPAPAPMKHGDHVSFRHGDVQGSGKVVGSGKDGVTVADEAGREHQVRHEHLEGPVAPPGGGGGDGPVPPDKFDANAFAAKFNDPNVTPEDILKGFPPDTASKIDETNKKIAAGTQTIDTFKKDGVYTPERTELHAKIIAKFLSPERLAAATPAEGEQPTFTILGGRGGSGKSWFNGKVFDPTKAIVLDADEIKHELPEYQGWNAALVHEESGDLFDAMTARAQELGVNLVHDATMKTAKKAVALVKGFKDAGYKTAAHYMYLPPQEAAKRAVHRFLGPTARFVPPGIVLGNTTNEGSFDQVKGLVDDWSFRDNNVAKGAEPRLISENGNGADGRGAGLSGLPAAGSGDGRGNPGVSPEADRRAQGQAGREDEGKPLRKAAEGSGGVGSPPLVLFRKAIVPGGAMGDLLAQHVQVAGHMRGGTYVAPFSSTRKKHLERAEKPTSLMVMPAPMPKAAAAIGPDTRMNPTPAPNPRIRKLSALQNGPTRHEAIVEHADGRKHLLAYISGKSGSKLHQAVMNRADRLQAATGDPDLHATAEGKGRVRLHTRDGKHLGHVSYSGRTQRDAIMEGEHPVMPEKGEFSPAAKVAPPPAASPVAPALEKPGIQLDEHGRDANGAKNCPSCGYAHTGPKCDNPMCRTNRSASQQAADDAEAAKRAGEEAERSRITAIRHAAMAPRKPDPSPGRTDAEKPVADAKHFYVSAIDGPKRHLVAGPYGSHEEALSRVDEVRAHAEHHQPDKATWMSWGTAGSAQPLKTPLGADWKRPAPPAPEPTKPKRARKAKA